MATETTIRMSEIIVPTRFALSKPSNEKMKFVRKYYEEYGCVDEPIIVNDKLVLVDGYIRYLVLKEKKVSKVDCLMKRKPVTYVYGKHEGRNKVYVWRVPKSKENSINIDVGDKALVETKNGKAVIDVVGVAISELPPIKQKIKKIVAVF